MKQFSRYLRISGVDEQEEKQEAPEPQLEKLGLCMVPKNHLFRAVNETGSTTRVDTCLRWAFQKVYLRKHRSRVKSPPVQNTFHVFYCARLEFRMHASIDFSDSLFMHFTKLYLSTASCTRCRWVYQQVGFVEKAAASDWWMCVGRGSHRHKNKRYCPNTYTRHCKHSLQLVSPNYFKEFIFVGRFRTLAQTSKT